MRTSRLQQKRDARKQSQQQNEAPSHLPQPNTQQQASTQLCKQKAQSLPQTQHRYLESPSTFAHASSQRTANSVAPVQGPEAQRIKSPQSFAFVPNQIGSQTHSSTTTTTTTSTGQMTTGLLRNQSPTYISQGTLPQPLPRYTVQGMQNFQQAIQEPIPKAPPQSAQQRSNYTQLANTVTTPISEPSFDYTQLANISSPAPQTSPLSQGLISTTTTTATQTNVATTPLEQRKAQREARRNHSEQQYLRNSTSSSNDLGGQARQAAAAKGDAELQRFDSTVQQLLMGASGSACPMGFRYYRGKYGYLCGGGNHLVSHEDVDNLVMYGVPPYIERVNDCESWTTRSVPPPAEGWDEPMHWPPQQRLANHMLPIAIKHDGTRWDLRPFLEQMALEEEAEAAMFGGYWG